MRYRIENQFAGRSLPAAEYCAVLRHSRIMPRKAPDYPVMAADSRCPASAFYFFGESACHFLFHAIYRKFQIEILLNFS